MGYTIIKISWFTQALGEPDPYEPIAFQFWCFTRFLQDNQLTTRRLANSIADLDEDFEIHTDDLTPEGLALMKRSYDRWVRKVERGMTPEDTRILERGLKRIRENS